MAIAAACNRITAAVLPRSVSISTLLSRGPHDALPSSLGLCSGGIRRNGIYFFFDPKRNDYTKSASSFAILTVVSAHHCAVSPLGNTNDAKPRAGQPARRDFCSGVQEPVA